MVTANRYVCAALICISWIPLAPAARSVYAAEDEESQTILAMLDAGLRQVAVDYIDARRRLAAGDLDIESKWVVRLSEFYAQSALRDASEQDWEESRAVIERFIAAKSGNRRQPWLQWQRARCDFLRAQSELAAHLAAPTNTARREKVLELVRGVLRRLDDLKRDITARLQVAARQRGSGGSEASAKQLNQLQVDASLLMCEAVWLRAQLYPPDSKDRIAAATLLTDTAAEVLIKTDGNWPSRPQLQIVYAAGQLQLSAASEGLQTLRRLSQDAPSVSLQSAAAQLAINYLCGQQSVSQARGLLDSVAVGTPQRQLAELQIALADLENKTPDTRDSELKRIVQLASEIRLRHGEYWGNRGDAMLVGSGASTSSESNGGTALDLLRVEVKQLIAAGEFESALVKLRSRVEIESAAGNSQAALELASQTAALLHQQGNSLDAARLLSKTSLDFSGDAQSAKQHQLSLAYLQRALRSSATQELLVEYEDALRMHLKTWPGSPESVLPTEWLTVWLTGQNRTGELLKAVWEKSCAGNLETAAGDMVQWLDAFAAHGDQEETLRSTEAWSRSPVQEIARLQDSVLAIASLLATWPSSEERPKLVAASATMDSLAAPADAAVSDDWAALSSVQQSVVCLDAVRGGNLASAKSLVAQWNRQSMPTNVLRAVGAELVDAIDFAPLEQHVAWSQAVGIDQIWADSLLEARSIRFKAVGLRMQGWIDGPSRSIEGLEQLRAGAPSDATVLMHLCRAFAESGKSRIPESTRLAKIIVKNTPATSDVHLFARWRWLANLGSSGDKETAADEAEYFLAVSPPDDAVWKKRFEAFVN